MIEIRRLSGTDAAQLFHHRMEGLQKVPTAFGSSYEEEVNDGPPRFEKLLTLPGDESVIFGAFDGPSLIGCVAIFREKNLKARHKAIIWGMYVKDQYQGKGVGKKLVLKAVEHARTLKDLKQVHLSCESANDSAKRLYSSCGFILWGTEPDALQVNGKFLDEDQMVLKLP